MQPSGGDRVDEKLYRKSESRDVLRASAYKLVKTHFDVCIFLENSLSLLCGIYRVSLFLRGEQICTVCWLRRGDTSAQKLTKHDFVLARTEQPKCVIVRFHFPEIQSAAERSADV